MTNAVAGLGLAPDAAMVTFPIEMFLPGSDISPVEARKHEFYDGLTRWRSAFAGDGAGEAPMIRVAGTSVEDAFARANHLMLANRWGDGLPLWPPTRERVDWILAGAAQPRAHVLGTLSAARRRDHDRDLRHRAGDGGRPARVPAGARGRGRSLPRSRVGQRAAAGRLGQRLPGGDRQRADRRRRSG